MITIDRTFRASILIKGVSGVLETLSGILFIVIGSAGLTSLAGTVAAVLNTGPVPAGLSADITAAITRLAALSAWYAAIYLLAHGLVKLALVWAVFAGNCGPFHA